MSEITIVIPLYEAATGKTRITKDYLTEIESNYKVVSATVSLVTLGSGAIVAKGGGISISKMIAAELVSEVAADATIITCERVGAPSGITVAFAIIAGSTAGIATNKALLNNYSVVAGRADQGIKGGLDTLNTKGLEVVDTRTAKIANEEWLQRGYDQPPYKPGTETKVVKAGNEEYVRVFSYKTDGTSNKLGGWVMKKSDIEGLTPKQIADKYALPVEPTYICDVNIPKDFNLQTGIANKVKGWGEGGGQQFDTMNKRLPVSSYSNERLIEN